MNARRRPRSALFNARRFADPTLDIEPRPSFRIAPSDAVYGIGSCFARAVAYMLAPLGHSVSFGGLYHRYNVFNILQTLRWAVDGPESFTADHLVAIDDGRWFDPHGLELSPAQVATAHSYDTLDEGLAAVRRSLGAVGRALRGADVMVLTLGLVEVWRDRRTGIAFNLMPPSKLIAGFDERFEIRRTRQAENAAAIGELFRLVRAANPRLKLICSVSPMPLRATFCFDDVLVATAYGKATLRSALQEAIDDAAAAGMRHIDYFPSYEIVAFQRNNEVFRATTMEGKPDGLHIREAFLEHSVKAAFLRAYVGESAPTPTPGTADPWPVDPSADGSDLASLTAGVVLDANQAAAVARLRGEAREARSRADELRHRVRDLADRQHEGRQAADYAIQMADWLRARLIDMAAVRLAADGRRRIALYGAGQHTRGLTREPWHSHGLQVVAILDDHPRLAQLDGVPIVRPEDLDEPIDAVVISSDAHEDAIAAVAEARFGPMGIDVVRLYGRSLETAAAGDPEAAGVAVGAGAVGR